MLATGLVGVTAVLAATVEVVRSLAGAWSSVDGPTASTTTPVCL